jgi:hypothetical protein
MSASVYLNLAIQAFQRSNPIGEMVDSFMSMVSMVINYKSNAKLNRFRHNLYMQQLNRMEGFLTNASPYASSKGVKIDRKF